MKNSVKTIVIVFTSLDIGGIERKIIDLASYYSTQNHTKLVILLKQKQGVFLKQVPTNVDLRSFTKYSYPILNLIFPLWIWKQLLKYKPKLILSFGNFSAICTIIANLFSINSKVVISEDSSIDRQISQDSFSGLRSIFIRLTYPLATGIIVLTQSAFNKIINYAPQDKVIIIPNWLPINIPRAQNQSIRPIDILFIGRLARQKNPLKFLGICREIQQKIPHLSVTMIGEGKLREQVKNYISRHRLKINLLPANTPVQPYYQSSKTFVLTSIHEGFPLTILESFYYYCPAICPDLEEIRPFYQYDPSRFIYQDSQTAVRLITTAIQEYPSLKKIIRKYHQHVATTRDQNFCATLDYLQQFL